MILIFVISVISTLTFLVSSISDDIYIYQMYAKDYKLKEQLYLISDTAINSIKQFLQRDDPNVDSFNDFWAKPIPIITEDAQIDITIIDQERYLNPNFLLNSDKKTVNKSYLSLIQRLFDNLQIDTLILYNILDWIDRDTVSQGGKEDYQIYTAKNDFIDSLEELKLIDGITQEIYSGSAVGGQLSIGLRSVFSPYSNGKVNVNTCSKHILMALDKDIDEALATQIVSYRQKKPFKNINDLALVDGMNSDIIYRIKNLNILDVKSENFLVDMKIKYKSSEYHLQVLLRRNNRTIQTIWRKIF